MHSCVHSLHPPTDVVVMFGIMICVAFPDSCGGWKKTVKGENKRVRKKRRACLGRRRNDYKTARDLQLPVTTSCACWPIANTYGDIWMTTPGVEPGLSRPRRDILATRRCGLWHCVSPHLSRHCSELRALLSVGLPRLGYILLLELFARTTQFNWVVGTCLLFCLGRCKWFPSFR